MDNKTIIEKYESEDVKSIFGYMYGKPFIDTLYKNGKLVREKDRVIEIEKELLELSKENEGFLFVWGYPGPDFNFYKFSDYGITWAFTREEIDDAEEAEDG